MSVITWSSREQRDHEILVEEEKKKEKNPPLGIHSGQRGGIILPMEQVRKILSIKRDASIVLYPVGVQRLCFACDYKHRHVVSVN